MFSVHLPSKMDIWQVRAYSLQAPSLTGLTPTSQCHLHKFLSLLPLLDPTQLLIHSRYKSLPLSCSPPGTICPVKMWLSRTRCTAPPPGSSPVTDSRGDPSFLYQGPHLKWDGVAKEHISLSTQGSLFFCSNEMRPLLCGSWRRSRSNQGPELPVWGQQSLRKSREKGSDEPVLPSLLLPLWTPSYASLSSRNTQAEVVTFPSSSMIFCNHNCFPNCI